MRQSKGVQAILWGGLLCGVLDLSAALVQYALRGVSPVRILQAIASGLLGASAFQGGPSTAAFGVVMHFVIAFGSAAVYWATSRKLPFLLDKTVLCGMSYGVGVYVFMNEVVLPLSRVTVRPRSTQDVLIGLTIHMLFVGLPIAWAARRAVRA